MDRTGQIFTGGWMGDSLAVFTRGWWGGIEPAPTPVVSGGSSGAGRPWPDRAINLLLPRRVLLDDEDVLMVLLDD